LRLLLAEATVHDSEEFPFPSREHVRLAPKVMGIDVHVQPPLQPELVEKLVLHVKVPLAGGAWGDAGGGAGALLAGGGSGALLLAGGGAGALLAGGGAGALLAGGGVTPLALQAGCLLPMAATELHVAATLDAPGFGWLEAGGAPGALAAGAPGALEAGASGAMEAGPPGALEVEPPGGLLGRQLIVIAPGFPAILHTPRSVFT
jgi:hypothetical protein